MSRYKFLTLYRKRGFICSLVHHLAKRCQWKILKKNRFLCTNLHTLYWFKIRKPLNRMFYYLVAKLNHHTFLVQFATLINALLSSIRRNNLPKVTEKLYCSICAFAFCVLFPQGIVYLYIPVNFSSLNEILEMFCL